MNAKKKIDITILIPILLFAGISIVTITSALTYLSPTLGNLALKQAIWYLVGGVLVLVLLHFKNDYLYQNAFVFYIILNVLLLLLLIFGQPINNSKCWFTIPGIGSFQPSEFMKVSLILVLGVMIKKFRSEKTNPSCKDEFIFLVQTFLIVLVPSILTFLEPDTGVVILYFVIYFFMLFASGIRLRWFLLVFIIGALLLGFVFGTYFLVQDTFIQIFGTKLFYRMERIFSWSDGSGLQLENALAAIGSAGAFGHGFNETPIYFPESGTDFIFAVFASNFGFFGSLILIAIICYFDYRLIHLAMGKIDPLHKFVLSGIISMLVFQQIQNIGMTLGLLPITGITLPFISYGGSSLLSYMLIVGIVLNISKEPRSNYL